MTSNSAPAKVISCALALLAFALPSAKGGVITWDAPQTISGPSDVLDNGTVVDAYDFFQGTTVNGATFTGFVTPSTGAVTIGGASDIIFLPYGSGSITAPYSNLLNGGVYLNGSGTDSAPTMTVTIDDLRVDDSYEVEFWVNDSRAASGSFDPQSRTDEVDGDPSLILDYQTSSGVGQFLFGTFTAATTSVSFTLNGHDPNGDDGSSVTQLNALEVVDDTSSAPEPSSMFLMGLGILTLATSARFRRA